MAHTHKEWPNDGSGARPAGAGTSQRTSEAVGVEASSRRRKAGAVGEAVHGAHTWSGAPATPARSLDRVAHAAVCQPARVALVQALVPGQVQLPHGGQRCTLPLALCPRACQGQSAGGAHVKDFTWEREKVAVRRVGEGGTHGPVDRKLRRRLAQVLAATLESVEGT